MSLLTALLIDDLHFLSRVASSSLALSLKQNQLIYTQPSYIGFCKTMLQFCRHVVNFLLWHWIMLPVQGQETWMESTVVLVLLVHTSVDNTDNCHKDIENNIISSQTDCQSTQSQHESRCYFNIMIKLPKRQLQDPVSRREREMVLLLQFSSLFWKQLINNQQFCW